MPKTIMFSKTFPKYHPRAGQQTSFEEKLLTGFLMIQKADEDVYKQYGLLNEFGGLLFAPKFHTIRSGHRWKVGDYFSPRQWQDKPYRSPQVTLWEDLKVQRVYDFDVDIKGEFYINGRYFIPFLTMIPSHDGLIHNDFIDWFKTEKGFSGQIIIWHDKINYDDVIS